MAERWAVLIDAENVGAEVADPLFERVATWGDAAVRRMFASFDGNHRDWKAAGAKYSIEPVHLPSMAKGKNGADIALVIDALDLMHRGHMDGFCIVSSDSDFTRLAWRLREEGRKVRGVGKTSAAATFREACWEFIAVETLLKPTAVASRAAKATCAKPAKRPAGEAVDLIRRAIEMTAREQGWARLAAVGSTLHKSNPGFDVRQFGAKNPLGLVRKTGAFEEKRPVQGSEEIRPKA
jgi:hypothetical protein